MTASAEVNTSSRFAVGGLHPERVVAPRTAEEAGALLKEANAQNWAVVPFGSGSKQHIGNALKKFDIALSLEHFHQILEFEPQDLVVKVQAGCPLVTLQAQLAQDGLCLPVDPPWEDVATVGGIVSSHDSGPLLCIRRPSRLSDRYQPHSAGRARGRSLIPARRMSLQYVQAVHRGLRDVAYFRLLLPKPLPLSENSMETKG